MVADLTEALEALDLAVARAAGVVGDQAVLPFAAVSLNARRRTGFLGATVVIALGGGTGVGKSSLLNALAGSSVAPTGALRPTTDKPLAWIPEHPEPGLVRLLDDLGIVDRVGQSSHPHLAVLDLPDFDSVVGEHRATVERLLPRVDAVLWVVDPEKYNDRTIHADYLRPLAGYQGQFVFALNQIDRLAGGELDQLLADLEQTLWHDGISQPVIFPLSAAPPGSPPSGLDPLLNFLDQKLDAKRVATAKLLEDLRRAGTGLVEVTGLTPGIGLEFDRSWSEASDLTTGVLSGMLAGPQVAAAAERAGVKVARRVGGGPLGRIAAALRRSPVGRALGAGREEDAVQEETRNWEGRAGLERALATLGGLVTELSFQAGGAFGARLRHEFGDQEVQRQVRGVIEGTMANVREPGVPRPVRWWSMAGFLQLLFFLMVIGCGVWIWASPDSFAQGTWPWPLIAAAGVILLSLGVGSLVRRSGRKAGRAIARSYRQAVETELADQLARRIGGPIRTVVRERAELEGALAELAVQVARAERLSG
ncbi:MAG: 50S ribosome-binding GTPase [Acidimicrobiia bacterium]|nr:50S ribosome-binding GTPase [Acidimicrobiia bacterium]